MAYVYGRDQWYISLEQGGQSMESPDCPHEGLEFAIASNGGLGQLINKSKYVSLVDIKYVYCNFHKLSNRVHMSATF